MKIFYFAGLREKVGLSEEHFDLPEGIDTVRALRAHLAGRGENWQALTQDRMLRVAVNQQMAGADTPLKGDDEVAFFPPVTGG